VPKRPLRICFVETADWAFSTHRIHIGRAALEAGMDVHVVAPAGDHGDKLRASGFVVHALRMRRASTNPLTEAWAIRDLTQLYRQIAPDVAHHVALKPLIYGSVAARIAGVPAIVGSVTGLGYAFMPGGARRTLLRGAVSAMLRAAIRGSGSHVIFQNPDDRALFLRGGLVRPEATSLVVGSGVDVQQFAPVPEPPGEVVVTAGCRMLWDKGIGELVEAARRVRSRGTPFKLILAGTPDAANPAAIPRQTLERWVADGEVDWVGHVTDMSGLLRRTHVACLPSYREGLPLFLAEAAAAGRPVITTDVPGCRSVLLPNESGLLVPVRDAIGLADALARLIESPELRQRMGAAGRELALRLFSRERVVEALFGVYRQLLVRRRVGGVADLVGLG